MKTALLPVAVFLSIVVFFAGSVAAQVSMTAIDSAVTENFNSLARTGLDLPFANNTTITGWYSNRAFYHAANGGDTAATLYSFGTSASSSERAFGSIAGSGNNWHFGVRLKNDTGTTITSLDISFTGEQWRKSGATSAQTLTVEYLQASTVTDVVTGTYTSVPALTFTSPIFTASSGSLVGNDLANRATLSTTINVTIPAGEEIMIRWTDMDNPGVSDHGLAIDDLSITPRGVSTRTVTKVEDTNDGVCDSDCSLREAIAVAVSGDTIAFASPLFDSPQTITLTLGTDLFVSSKDLTITGPGANKLTIDGGASTNRIFAFSNSTVTLTGMKLTGGGGDGSVVSGAGGAIIVQGTGTVTLDGLYITGNSAVNGGGLYAVNDDLVIRNSTFSGNAASNTGGAIARGAGPVTITNTTVSGNTAPNGAITRFGGASPMTIRNSTIIGNTGTVVGGIYAEGIVSLSGSIVAGNTGTYPEIYNQSGTVGSSGYNLVGDSAGDSTSTNVAISYQLTDIRDTDPQLGLLALNVGTTPVHTPNTGSPVIDKGFAFLSVTDQRGSSRTYDDPSIANAAGGDGTDIGSVELQPTLAADVSLAGKVTNALGQPIRAAQITVQGSDGVVRRTLTSQFGYYRITGLEAGGTYFVTVKAKRYTFANPTQSVNASDNLTGINFTAQP